MGEEYLRVLVVLAGKRVHVDMQLFCFLYEPFYLFRPFIWWFYAASLFHQAIK